MTTCCTDMSVREGTIHILLVEDQEAHAELVRRALASGGDRVCLTWARSLAEARAHLADSPPDLLITDFILPDGEGLELLPFGDGESPFPTILMTGQGDERVVVEAMRAGALDYVVKSQAAFADMPRTAQRALREWNNITERKRAQAEVRKSREFLQTVLDGLPDAIIVVDREFRVVLANRAMRAMTGGDDPVSRCLTCYQLLHHRDTPCHETALPCTLDEAISAKAPVTATRTYIDGDGRDIPVEVVAAPIFDEAGEVVQIIQSCRDISERKRDEEARRQLEAQLQQTQKLESLGVLAGGIAHDFNNLLVGVLGNARLALEELAPDSPARELVRSIESAAIRAAELTNQMLAYSGRGKFVVEPVNLSDLVEEMIHLLEASISKKYGLQCDFPDTLPAIEADATQLRQVVMNLVINASEALGDESGLIAVRTGVMEIDEVHPVELGLGEVREGAYVYVEVTDTGCGMDGEARAKLFDPFFTTKFTGRGLGLAAVLGIVRGHRGAIQVDSAPGRGTTFRVLFPPLEQAVPAKPARRRERIAPALPPSGTVLVVDDEETVRSVATRALTRRRFNVLTARDGREALELFREHQGRIDVVLLDMTMPHLGGEEVFRALLQMCPDVRVVLSSGYDEQDATERFEGAGLAGFIQKPYTPGALVEKLSAVIGVGRPG